MYCTRAIKPQPRAEVGWPSRLYLLVTTNCSWYYYPAMTSISPPWPHSWDLWRDNYHCVLSSRTTVCSPHSPECWVPVSAGQGTQAAGLTQGGEWLFWNGSWQSYGEAVYRCRPYKCWTPGVLIQAETQTWGIFGVQFYKQFGSLVCSQNSSSFIFLS